MFASRQLLLQRVSKYVRHVAFQSYYGAGIIVDYANCIKKLAYIQKYCTTQLIWKIGSIVHDPLDICKYKRNSYLHPDFRIQGFFQTLENFGRDAASPKKMASLFRVLLTWIFSGWQPVKIPGAILKTTFLGAD